jgi:3-(3-hydroxy-phenyl)propionate hydroxylase
MGQGMCAGIRDVVNLAWKLAAVVRGADAMLLDSYETERRPNAREYVATAARLGGLINASGTEAALRAALPQADGSARMESLAPPLGPGLGNGTLAGRLFGQPRLADGHLMDDGVGYAPVLVADAALSRVAVLPADLAVVTTEDAPDADQHLARFGCRAALLRPDRHILATADDPEDLARLCRSVLPILTPKHLEIFG